jgi:hypothetical protein
MAFHTWTGIDNKVMDAVATSRLMQNAATVLGASLGTAESREAVLAEVAAFMATYTPTEIITLTNQLRRLELYKPLGNPTFAIDTNFDVKSTEPISYLNGGTLKTLADNTNFNTGTAKTITGAKWGAAVLSVNSSGTGVVTWAPAAAYDSEALAIAALTDPGATDTILGYFTNLAHASGFTAGTDALQGGAGGNVSTTTNYYNSLNPNSLLVGAAIS